MATGSPPFTCTVAVTTCGASMACGSLTVTLAVYVPQAKLDASTVNSKGTLNLPSPGFVCGVPTVTVSHLFPLGTDALSGRVPSTANGRSEEHKSELQSLTKL